MGARQWVNAGNPYQKLKSERDSATHDQHDRTKVDGMVSEYQRLHTN